VIALPSGGPLLERDAELAVIDGLVRGLSGGEARVLLLEGEAGIGKSRLLAELRRLASNSRVRVLTARGSELERSFSFGVVRQLLERAVLDEGETAFTGAAAGARPIFGPPSEEAPQGSDDGSFAALHGLYWLTVNLTSSVPLVLAIDDLHWADRASLRFLAYLVRRFEGLPLLVAATLRPAEQPSDPALVAELAHDIATVTLRPGPLSSAAVASVVEEALGAPEPAFVEACRETTGGNPLLLAEVLRVLGDERVPPEDAEAGTVGELGANAAGVILHLRLRHLDPAATAAARALAVLGDGAPLPRLAALAELSEREAGQAVVALTRAEIVRQQPPLGFTHPLVGDAVYRGVPEAEREQAHARAARLLGEAAVGDEPVAAHLLLAAPRGDVWAVERLQGAARTAVSRGDADSAAAFLARALAEPPPDGLRASLRFQLGVAEAFANGPAAAVHLREAYEEAADPVLRATIALVLANISIFTEGPAAVARLTGEAAANAPSPELRSLLEAIGLTTAYWHPALRSDALFERLRRGDVEPGPGGAMKLAMAAYDWSMRGGTAADCVALARRALQGGHLLRHDNGGTSVVAALLVLAMADHDDAERLVDGSFRAAHAHGSLFSSCAAFVFGGYVALLRGELAESERLLHTAIEQIESWGFDTVRAYPYCFLADLELERGNVAAAAEAVERAGLPPGPPVNVHTGWWAVTRLRLLLARGEAREAVDLADEAIARLGTQVANPSAHPWHALRARGLWRLGRTAEADAAAAEQVRRARVWGGPRGLARALRTLASVRRTEAVVLLQEAVAAVEGSPARLEHARSLAALGAALRDDGRPAEAREPLRLALELTDVCGAPALLEQVRSELHAAGARPRSGPSRGPDSLTPSERRVAELAVAGQSNRDIAQALFVTPKTVEVHLSSTYRKLGIRSRRELEGALAA
jgi:DNA-binding NarL/FixJ family response regulator